MTEEYGGLIVERKFDINTTAVFVHVDEKNGVTWIQDIEDGQETKFRAFDSNNQLRRTVDVDTTTGHSMESSYDAEGNLTMQKGVRGDTSFVNMKSPIDGNWIEVDKPLLQGHKPIYRMKISKGDILLKDIVVVDYQDSTYLMKRFYPDGSPQAEGKFRMPKNPDDNPQKMLQGDLDEDKIGEWFFWTESGEKSVKSFD